MPKHKLRACVNHLTESPDQRCLTDLSLILAVTSPTALLSAWSSQFKEALYYVHTKEDNDGGSSRRASLRAESMREQGLCKRERRKKIVGRLSLTAF